MNENALYPSSSDVIDSILKEVALSFKTKEDLFLSYMPFISHGGLFISGKEGFQLGEQVAISLTLPNENNHAFIGNVIWITPKGAQGNMKMGVGVEIPSDALFIKEQIEDYLREMDVNAYNTDTM